MRTRTLLLALVAAGALATGCSDQPTTGALSDEGPWPLTGLPGYPDDAVAQVLTVKVDDTASGRPQAGIGDADLVIQQMVEGGVTRLAVMFHSRLTPSAGPVRSVRETDIGLVLPTGGTVAASGGADTTVAAVQSAGIPIVVEGAPGFSRDLTRSAPYNLMLDVSTLAATLPGARPPAAYLPFGDVPGDAPAQEATEVELQWPNAEASFEADEEAGTYSRTDLADPAGFAFTNIVALMLSVTYDGGNDSSGAAIPTMRTEGSGTGQVITGGQAYDVRWSKPTPSSAWVLTYAEPESATSHEFTIPPGRTWLALLPEDGGSVKVSAPQAGSPAPSP